MGGLVCIRWLPYVVIAYIFAKFPTTQDLICRAHQVVEDSELIDLRGPC